VVSDNKLYGLIRDNSSNNGNVATKVTVNDGKWHHGVFTRSGTITTVYLDGSVSGITTNPGLSNVIVSDGSVPLIGRFPNSSAEFYQGDIKQLRVFQFALDPGSVKRIYRGLQ
jgi:hypothetical protein